MPGGYVGKLLRVDLSKETLTEERLPGEDVLRKYIGGLGLGAKILYDELPPNARPLDPENPLIFMTGPLTGTPVPTGNDYTVVTFNMDTGYTVAAGHSHGYFGAFLKSAGYDGIIIQGAAKRPVYLWIHDGQAELRDASHLWGEDSHDTEDLVRQELGGDQNISVATIGIGGENLVHGAGIFNEKHHMAGKGGVGAVMGSKKLKAIAVRGRGGVPIAKPKELLDVAQEWREKIFEQGPPGLYHGGITRFYNVFATGGSMIAGKNYTSAAFGAAYANGIVEEAKKFRITPVACFSCPIACSYRSEITTGPHRGYVATLGGGGENQEGSAAMPGVSEPGTVHYLTDLMDRLGLDSSPPGSAIGMAFECYERGILTKEDTDGLELKWGNAEAVEQLLWKMAKREGFGAVLAEGPKRAAERIGGDAPKYAVHMKGQGINLHDWRPYWGLMLGQAISPGGPSWQGGSGGNDRSPQPDLGYLEVATPYTPKGKPEAVKRAQRRRIIIDCIGVCFFAEMGTIPNSMSLFPRAIAATTGWEDFTLEEALQTAERVLALERVFNMKHGLTLESDLDISPRLLEAPYDGIAQGKTWGPHVEDMIHEYYELMGWDRETGKPLPETLRHLGLEELTKEIWEEVPAS